MLGVGIRIQIHFVHVWLKKKTNKQQNPYVLKQWSAVAHSFCSTQCRKRGEEQSRGGRQRYVIALQFQWLGEQTVLIFWRQFIIKTDWKGLCKWKKGPEPGQLKADSNNTSFIWLWEISDFSRACESTHFSETKQDTVGFHMRNFFFSASEKLEKKEGSFQFLKQWRSKLGSRGGGETESVGSK